MYLYEFVIYESCMRKIYDMIWYDNYKYAMCTKSNHLTRGEPEGKLSHPWGNTRQSWTHPSTSFLWLTSETKRWNLNLPTVLISISKIKNMRRTHLLCRQGKHFLLIFRQLPMKVACWSTLLVLLDFTEAICKATKLTLLSLPPLVFNWRATIS